ncbi:hypothetical protein PDO_5230, partial [Rhizobium sp. PDO1-076]|uniref:hypothetical protein n=1 Tax=Rhizobium sp. PDO1-076 TaxID=1125979 RepID=UPI00024E25CB
MNAENKYLGASIEVVGGINFKVKAVHAFNGGWGPFSYTATFDVGNPNWPSGVQAKLGNLGFIAAFDPTKSPISSLVGLGAGYASSQPFSGANISSFVGFLLDSEAFKLVGKFTASSQFAIGGTNIRPLAGSSSIELTIISSEPSQSPFLHGSGLPSSTWQAGVTYVNQMFNYTGPAGIEPTQAWSGFDTPSEILAAERLRDLRTLQADQKSALSLEARDERVSVRAATPTPSFRESENMSMDAYERQKTISTPSYRQSEIASMAAYDKQKSAATPSFRDSENKSMERYRDYQA